MNDSATGGIDAESAWRSHKRRSKFSKKVQLAVRAQRSTHPRRGTITPSEPKDSSQGTRGTAGSGKSAFRVETPIRALQSPALYRNTLWQAFTQDFIPSEARGVDTVTDKLDNAFRFPLCVSMEASTDALCLLQLGASTKDGRLLLEGRKRQLVALRWLQEDLQDPKTDFSGIHATAQKLLLSEIYNAVSRGPNAYKAHIGSLIAMVTAQKRKETDLKIDFCLFRALRLFGLMHCFISRRARGLERTISPRLQVTVSRGSLESLIEIALRIPGLMELADAASTRNVADEAAIFRIGKLIYTAEDNLKWWLVEYYGTADPPTEVPWCFESFLSCPPFPGDVPSMLRFPSFLNMGYHCLYWICLLLLREASLNLVRTLSLQALQRVPAELRKDFVEETDSPARLLCRSMPFIWTTPNASVCKATAVRAPLYFAGQWFLHNSDSTALAWCQKLEFFAREEVPYLEWDALLPWSVFGLIWLSP